MQDAVLTDTCDISLIICKHLMADYISSSSLVIPRYVTE